MLKMVFKSAIITALSLNLALAAKEKKEQFNKQAEKDRIAMQKYYLLKFSDPLKKSAHFFPYVDTEDIRKNYIFPVKLEDFAKGVAAWYKPTRDQLAEFAEMPPYLLAVEEGEALWKKPFANGKTYNDCFGSPAVLDKYPYFDTQRNEVITIDQAVNECRVANGEKPYTYGKEDLEKIIGYMAMQSRGKKINVKIPSKEAAEAYERGKKNFYKQRGYFYLSCAECHVEGSGASIRAEKLSTTLGAVTHFPVYRIKNERLLTLQERLAGCWEDTGALRPKEASNELKEIEYFLYYMSNGFKLDGPDTRK